MVLRIIRAVGALGVQRVLLSTDTFGIAAGVLRELRRLQAAPPEARLRLPEIEYLTLPQPTSTAADTTGYARMITARCAAAVVLLGGDGTMRAAAPGLGDTPMLALSTGTNNVFPIMMEATIAGMAVGTARPAPATESQAAFREVAAAAIGRYRAGDVAGAVDIWARGVFGARYRASLDHGLPGVFEEILACADTFFDQELPAVQQWSFAETDARRIAQPVLAVLGENSAPTFRERRDLLLAWLPSVEPFDLPGATHLLHIERPHEMAEALSSFFARHPLEPSS